jgi:O-antigen/teichoic acid export membrane protein
LSIPIVVVSSALTGVLEALQRFRFVNAVRMPLGLATFLVPLMILPISNSLVSFVAALVSVRALAAVAYASLCFSVVQGLGAKLVIAPAVIPSLLRLGGWMTVSNLISPMMVYLDRFFVGAAISMAAVTYYTTPYEFVTRALMLPRAVMGVLFPEFSSILVKDTARAADLFRRWRNYLFAMMFPFAFVVVTLAGDLLTLWLGQEFAIQSTRVLRYLAMGVLINSLAQLAFALIQSAGRPEITAKIHLIELPFYLVTLWWLIEFFGIDGAAMAWVLRVGVDALIMFVFAHRILRDSEFRFWRSAGFILVILAIFSAGAYLPDLRLRLLYIIGILSVFVPFVWLVLLDQDDRHYLLSRLTNASR